MRESRRCYGDVHDDFRALASDREAPEAAALPLLLTELPELGLVLGSKAERRGVADMFACERPGQKLSELGQTNGEIVTVQRARLWGVKTRSRP
jgi:Fe2+ transport system protein FeoA